MTDDEQDSGRVQEPDNSTVDDWYGQRVDRDKEKAEQILDEEDGDEEAAARRFDDEAEGARPEDLPTEQRRT